MYTFLHYIVITFLVPIFLLPIFLNAQERTILKPIGITVLREGKSNNLEVIPISKMEKQKMRKIKNTIRDHSNFNNTLNFTDTLWTVADDSLSFTNFGFFGQERMVQWFEAPTNILLKEVGFAFYSAWPPVANIEMKIVVVNYAREDLEYLSNEWVGSYEAIGNGYHDITAFLDDPDRTGPWVPVTPGTPEVFGNDIRKYLNGFEDIQFV